MAEAGDINTHGRWLEHHILGRKKDALYRDTPCAWQQRSKTMREIRELIEELGRERVQIILDRLRKPPHQEVYKGMAYGLMPPLYTALLHAIYADGGEILVYDGDSWHADGPPWLPEAIYAPAASYELPKELEEDDEFFFGEIDIPDTKRFTTSLSAGFVRYKCPDGTFRFARDLHDIVFAGCRFRGFVEEKVDAYEEHIASSNLIEAWYSLAVWQRCKTGEEVVVYKEDKAIANL